MSGSSNAIAEPNFSVPALNAVTYAYRRFGNPAPGTPPLVMLPHFRGNRKPT
jgi:hypothetical protein